MSINSCVGEPLSKLILKRNYGIGVRKRITAKLEHKLVFNGSFLSPNAELSGASPFLVRWSAWLGAGSPE
jgi:hypothetical protein